MVQVAFSNTPGNNDAAVSILIYIAAQWLKTQSFNNLMQIRSTGTTSIAGEYL